MSRSTPRRLLARLAVAVGTSAAVAMLCTRGPAAFAGADAVCGSSTVSTVANVDSTAANDIYANELAGTEVSFDSEQITGAPDLLAAVATDNRPAALAAVKRLVFHPAWHIVRLRALDADGRILADVGGPYVIAPVAGTLRYHGRVVGSFIMSVQDDTGYTKLETRFVGDPIGIYVGGKLVAERYADFPAAAPSGSSLTIGRLGYLVLREADKAFPNGTLDAVILVPPASGTLEAQPCSQVRADEFGRIAERVARLAMSLPQHYPGFARTVNLYTGADIFVRDGGTQLASIGGSGPATLPTSGTITYDGRSWLVFSFEPGPSTRVYVLAPPA